MSMRALHDALERYEPNTPPSRRYNRLVTVGFVDVLEMRDPNDGQSHDPATKARHQYLLAGGMLWSRRLPPETVGDAWVDTGVPRWEPMTHRPPAPSLILDYAEGARAARVAIVTRQRMQRDGVDGFVVRSAWADADDCEDVKVVAGPITDAWHDVPLPPCPDCGGDLVWYEAGYVPGTRKCCGTPVAVVDDPAYPDGKRRSYADDGGCGSLFSVG